MAYNDVSVAVHFDQCIDWFAPKGMRESCPWREGVVSVRKSSKTFESEDPAIFRILSIRVIPAGESTNPLQRIDKTVVAHSH